MRHNLRITVSKERPDGGVIACKHLTVREKLLRFLLGKPVKLTVLVPGDNVEEVTVTEAGKEVPREAV